jgi:predicted transcriptional regulator
MDCETPGQLSISAANKPWKGIIMSDAEHNVDVLALTAEIISAHIANNAVAASSLPALIQDVYRSLSGTVLSPALPDKLVPAVPVKKSVFPDHIVCLEDGKKLKMLKRHLKTAYNLTPEAYRVRWGLSPDYPMVCPDYASRRSTLAKQIGLGTKGRKRA